jgi:hypothetical protein
VLRLCEVFPGICLTTEEKTRKNLSQGSWRLSLNAYQIERDVIHSSRIYIYITCHQIFGYGLLIVCSFYTQSEYEGSACRYLSWIGDLVSSQFLSQGEDWLEDTTLAAAANWSLGSYEGGWSITCGGPGPVTKLQTQCSDSGDDRVLPATPLILLLLSF